MDAAELGLVHLAAILADAIWRVLHEIAAWPWSAVAIPPPSALKALLAGGAAVLALPAHALPGRRLLWLALVPLLVMRAPRPPPGAAEVLVFDVGHGLAVLVETAQHNLLYDAGPVFRSGFDTGSEILVPVLARRGITRLDTLLISHSDSDHAGGARAVLAAYPDAEVRKGPDVAALEGTVCVAGQAWEWDGVKFEILHPSAEFADRGNDSSCVLKVVTHSGSLLLPGDIEARGERALTAEAELAADVVIVPHHGSTTSSSPPFVARTQPRFAVVSAAHDNRWGLPREEITQRWVRAGATVLTTAETGAIVIDLDGDTPRLTSQRQIRRRYWHAESGSLLGEQGTGAL
jgi:competence protein ComEC